ncbi:MAG: LptF/LptG family permease [Flavobacteriales bacterium]
MKILDRYIIFKYLGSYVFMLLVLMSIAIVFDVSEKLEDFIRTQVTFKEIVLDYYLNFFLHYASLLSSFIAFLTVIYFTSMLTARSEIIAVLSGGVSFQRLLLPYIVGASIIALGTGLLNHFVIPQANKERLLFESRNTNYSDKFSGVHLEIEPGRIVYYKLFYAKNIYVDRFWMENWEDDGSGKKVLVSEMQADRAYGDSVSNKWKLENWFIRYHKDLSQKIVTGRELDTVFNFKLTDLGQRESSFAALNTPDLIEYRDKELKKGSNQIAFIEIELHQRTSFPFATLILTLMGVSVASKKSREGIGLNIALGLILGVTYIFVMKVTTVAAVNAGMNVLFAVWLPNILFTGVAIWLYRRAIQ